MRSSTCSRFGKLELVDLVDVLEPKNELDPNRDYRQNR